MERSPQGMTRTQKLGIFAALASALGVMDLFHRPARIRTYQGAKRRSRRGLGSRGTAFEARCARRYRARIHAKACQKHRRQIERQKAGK